MKAYITAIESISAQDSFQKEEIDFVATDSLSKSCIEPVYKTVIPPAKLRRMSKVVKMGVACALSCHKKQNEKEFDAIVIGTGLGCVKDTEKFLGQLIENKESLLNPTSFIQSTHNTVSGQVALLLKNHAYNFTFSQERFSFESALLESLMLMDEGEAKNVLVGGLDELTDESLTILQDLPCVRTENKTNGHTPGEGAAFFTLSNKKTEESKALISGMTLVHANDQESASKKLDDFLSEIGLNLKDIDLILSGKNGESSYDTNFDAFYSDELRRAKQINFKDYAGEYDTSCSFALWMSSMLIDGKSKLEGTNFAPKTILIHNQDTNKNHSLILVQKC